MNNRNFNKKIWSSFPLFILLCFSGNPYFTNQNFSKSLLVIYTLIFSAYVKYKYKIKFNNIITKYIFFIILFITLVSIAQKFVLGFVSYLSIGSIITKILLAFFTVIYYQQKQVNILDIYIKIMTVLVILSLPFFLINQFVQFGFNTNSSFIKSIIIFTSIPNNPDYDYTYGIIRNPGMFWEAGAFAGYLLLALVFIALQNKRFSFKGYNKETFIIILGITTTLSTTGLAILSIIIVFFVMQHFKNGKIIFVPATIITIILVYSNLAFMQSKINAQFEKALHLRLGDYSNTRFGSLVMDAFYIKEHPIIGNGTHIKTRYKYNYEIIDDIGHGNGMSNFVATWGIPLFLFWLYCVYKFTNKITKSNSVSIGIIIIILLILQGEQFLNYPMFLMFFVLPSFLTAKSKTKSIAP